MANPNPVDIGAAEIGFCRGKPTLAQLIEILFVKSLDLLFHFRFLVLDRTELVDDV